MLTRKHFIEFADFLISLFNRNTQLICDITNDIDKDLSEKSLPLSVWSSNSKTWESATCKNLGIDKIIEKRLLDYYNNNGKEIQLLLDRNSLRFNKYRFKNYIISHVEKKQLNNINNSAKNNETITKRGIQ